jgi:hypothetical protein
MGQKPGRQLFPSQTALLGQKKGRENSRPFELS